MITLKRLGLVALLAIVAVSPLLSITPAPANAQDKYGNVSEDNCTVTPFDIAGQGNYSLDGASGGVVPDGITREQIIMPNGTDLQFVKEIGPNPVAILVIDDFFEYRGEIAHGRLVTDQLLAMIQAHPNYAFAPRQIRTDPVVWQWDAGGKYGSLYLIEVDTEDYNTQQLRGFVENAVNMAVREYGVKRVVLNMSFVLIPCTTPDYDLKTLRAARQERETPRADLVTQIAVTRQLQGLEPRRNAQALVNEALIDNPRAQQAVNVVVQYAQLVRQKEIDTHVLDPLHDYIKLLLGEGQYWNPTADVVAFAVGSAGNFGRRVDSFVPAAWPEVASISASIGRTRVPWVGSNRGQLMLPGGLFAVGDLYLIGTSFSAPVLSMNMAFYLTHEPICDQPPILLDQTNFTDARLVRALNRRCGEAFQDTEPPGLQN